MKKLQQAVIEVLEEEPKARANDPYLIYKVFVKMGWGTDLEEIAKNGENRYESVSRIRRKVQQTNPNLRPESEVTRMRKAREEKFKELARGL